MIPVSYLFEGKIKEHLKKHAGKYALGTTAAGLYYSDDITPDPIKNVIRRGVTGRETINTPEELLKGYENHPHYKEYKDIADKLDKKDLNRLTKFGIHNADDMPDPGLSNAPPGTKKVNIGGWYNHKQLFPNFRDRELRVRGDLPAEEARRIFKHELGHHIDLNKDSISKGLDDSGQPYHAQKREYIARKFAKEHEPSKESYQDFIKRTRDESNKLSPEERSKYMR